MSDSFGYFQLRHLKKYKFKIYLVKDDLMEELNEIRDELKMDKTIKKDVGPEVFIFLAAFLGLFIYMGSIMGGTNMIKTMMMTSYDLLMNVCLYLMAVAVLAGGISAIFSEFGVIALVNRLVSKIIKPI